MNVGELTSSDLHCRLRAGRFFLRTGPLVASIRTPLGEVAEAVAQLYADFPIDAECEYADFFVRLAPAPGWRNRLHGRYLARVGGYHQFDPFPRAMAVPYLEWALNWCVANHAHHKLILHAATLERGGRAVVLLGTSGSGKSTLCAALALQGWRLLSDEMAILSPEDLSLTALARPISLKNESIPLLRALAPQAVFGPLSEGQRKGKMVHMRPDTEAVRRVGESAQPAWLVFVQHESEAAARLQPLSQARALLAIARCAFNYSILGERGFETLARLIDRCPPQRLVYSRLDEALPLLEEKLFSQPHVLAP